MYQFISLSISSPDFKSPDWGYVEIRYDAIINGFVQSTILFAGGRGDTGQVKGCVSLELFCCSCDPSKASFMSFMSIYKPLPVLLPINFLFYFKCFPE